MKLNEKALGAAIIEGSNMAGERLVTQIVTAYLKALGDEGWVLVPKEPTDEMLWQGNAARTSVSAVENTRATWRAMLSAAVG